MTSMSQAGRTTERSYGDPRNAGPWYKCPSCDKCQNNREQFLIHLSSHDLDVDDQQGDQDVRNKRCHSTKATKRKTESENKPIFHTHDGSVLRINELPNAYAIFTPKIQLRPLELICRDSEVRVQQPGIKLLRPTEADLQAALEEANKRQLRRKPRRKYGGALRCQEEDLMSCEENIDEDDNYDPKYERRGRKKSMSKSNSGRPRKETSELSSPKSGSVPVKKTCVSCFPSIPFQTVTDFSAHITEVHCKDGTYFCTSCPLTTTYRQSIVKHNCRKDLARIWKGLQTCGKCGKSISKYLIKDHLEMHKRKDERNKLKPFRCVICQEGFTQKCNLQRHMFKHVENNPFVCTFPGCNHSCTGKYPLQRHMDLHSGIRVKFPCTICNKDFSRKGRLMEHNRLYHSEDGPKRTYYPRKTIQIIKRWSDLGTQASETTHPLPMDPRDREPDNVPVPTGSRSMSPDVEEQGNNARFYLDSIHLGDEETIKAEALEALLDVNQELEARGMRELEVKTEPDMRDDVKPSVSGASDSSNDEPTLRVRSKTVGTRPKVVSSKVNLDLVQLLGTKYTNRGDEGAFPCKICTKISYSRLHHLLTHMKRVHPEEGAKHLGEISAESGIVFSCGSCGFQTKTSQEYSQHMKKHVNKKFRCPNCRVRFKSQPRLDKHIKDIHQAKKRFKCDQCDKEFGSSGGLRWHRRKIHVLPPENPQDLTCQDCGRTASSTANLKTHMLLHSKNRVMSYCQICNEKLSCPASLRRHIRLMHMKDKSAVGKANEPIPEDELFL